MNQEDLEDATIAASFANQTRQYFKERFKGNNPTALAGILPDQNLQVDPKKIVMRDWRNLQTQPQYQQPQFQPQQPVVPYGVMPDPSQFGSDSRPLLNPILGVDDHGNLIKGDPLAALAQPQQQAPQSVQYQQPLQTTGFQLPNFGQPPAKSVALEEDKFDLLVKEIKGLKKSINKLIRDQEQRKLEVSEQPTKTEIENQDKS